MTKKPTNGSIGYGRKPYLGLDADGSHRAMMKKPTRRHIQNQAPQPYSKMDKPYLAEDYPDMEHFAPWPEITQFQPVWPWPPVAENAAWLTAGGYCLMVCISPLFCEDPVLCAVVRASEVTFLGKEYKLKAGVENGAAAEVDFGGTNVHPIRVLPPGGSWAVYPEQDQDVVRVTATSGSSGISCYDRHQVFCYAGCSCGTADTFEFDDDATSDTIDPGDSITLYVSGGCPPFSWSVSDKGYTLAYVSTQARTNTLMCAGGT